MTLVDNGARTFNVSHVRALSRLAPLARVSKHGGRSEQQLGAADVIEA